MSRSAVDAHGGRSSRDPACTRRELLVRTGALVGGLLLAPRALRAETPFVLPEATRRALDGSPLVYVSPLKSDGSESRCHGEVWFFVDGGSVVIMTDSVRWKARAVRRSRDRARVWVGDFGPVARADDRYRKAPSFLAKAEIDAEPELFTRLMESFSRRYADEWDTWGPRFLAGWDDGSRVLIRYTPIGV